MDEGLALSGRGRKGYGVTASWSTGGQMGHKRFRAASERYLAWSEQASWRQRLQQTPHITSPVRVTFIRQLLGAARDAASLRAGSAARCGCRGPAVGAWLRRLDETLTLQRPMAPYGVPIQSLRVAAPGGFVCDVDINAAGPVSRNAVRSHRIHWQNPRQRHRRVPGGNTCTSPWMIDTRLAYVEGAGLTSHLADAPRRVSRSAPSPEVWGTTTSNQKAA